MECVKFSSLKFMKINVEFMITISTYFVILNVRGRSMCRLSPGSAARQELIFLYINLLFLYVEYKFTCDFQKPAIFVISIKH